MVFLNNGSTGGTDIIAACVNKYHDISLGQVLMGVDILIVGSCLFFPQFGDIMERLHKMVFGYCTMFIECFYVRPRDEHETRVSTVHDLLLET